MLKNNFDFFKMTVIFGRRLIDLSSYVLKFGNYQNWKNAHAVCFQNKQ